MEFTIYILYSHLMTRFYCGQTDDFSKRIDRHNSGLVKTTKPGIPWIKVWTVTVASRSEVLMLERKIKKRGIKRHMIDLGFDFEEIIGERDVASRLSGISASR
jgi:putative endonuclease